MPRILIVEDDEKVGDSLKKALEKVGHAVETARNAKAGLTSGMEEEFDVVVSDLHLTGNTALASQDGFEIIRQLHEAKPHLPIILITADKTTEHAMRATKLGAYDYILKGFDMTTLLIQTIDKALANRPTLPPAEKLEATDFAKDAIIGNSRVMQEVYMDIGRLAAKPVTVLIRGETGTGKELVARALHKHSDRAAKPFIAVNCVAIPETLLESELFGHEKGAFTGATDRSIGRFEQAHHGTIFLDEIGDMSMSTQAKLLRVLQEKTIQRLGGRETLTVDVRIIAATHRDLEMAIKNKEFREDLYYRLNVAAITLPPLQDRKEDIPTLVSYFLQRYGTELGAINPSISAEAIELLLQHSWPGNVRELENTVRKALLSARSYESKGKTATIISVENIESALSSRSLTPPPSTQSLPDYISQLLAAASRGEQTDVRGSLMEMVERELYAQAMKIAEGNQAKAARWLGVSRPTMREKLTQYGIRLPDGETV